MTERIAIGADGRKYITTEPAPVQQELAHTDHPSRHYDRTCAACNAPVQQDVNKQLLKALKAIADYPELDALEMKREARAAIAAAERE